VDQPCWVTAGDYLLVASGLGKTVEKAKDKAYDLLKTIEVPNNPFWRPDIGDRLKDQIPLLQKHGYARNLSY